MRKLLTFALVGFFAQLVDGSLGMAYGATSATLLVALGFSPALASASIHLAEMGTTAASGVAHWRFRNTCWRTVRWIGVPGAAGAFVGAYALGHSSAERVAPWVALFLLSLGAYILVRFGFPHEHHVHLRRPLKGRTLALLGIVAGFLDAVGGGGWGPISTPALLSSESLHPRQVVGSVDTSEFLVSTAASVGFFASMGGHQIDPFVVGTFLVGGLLAAPLAAWLVRFVPPKMLGAGVGGLLLMTNMRTAAHAFGLSPELTLRAYTVIGLVWAAAIVRTATTLRTQRAAT